MTKFIQIDHDTILNMDYVNKILVGDNGELIARTKDDKNYCFYVARDEESMDYSRSLALEFCLLIASHPQGVFIFNKEHLLSQKALREKQQLEAAKEVVEVKVTEPKRVGKTRAAKKKGA